jgi:EmrB/QacA subfamily drug resistance transporter
VVGATIFGAASLACALSTSGTMLLIARTVQGVGAAIVFPLSLALVMIVFPVEQRGTAIGVFGLTGTAGLALGPLCGGLLAEYLSWRWIFTVNVVAAVAVTMVVIVFWREPARAAREPLDWRGLVALVTSLTLLVLSIMQGAEWGWGSPLTIGALVVGVASAIAFWRIERAASDPLIQVTLFRSKSFTAFNSGVFIGQFSKSTVIVFLPLYLQQELGYSAIEAGLALMPGMILNVATAMPAGRWIDRVGSGFPLLLGLGGLLAAHVALAGLVDVDDYAALLPVLIVWGPAAVLVFQGALTGVANAVPVEMQGQASGISNESQMLGGAFGVAVMSALQVGGASWAVVFAASALVALTVFVIGIVGIPRRSPDRIPAGSPA